MQKQLQLSGTGNKHFEPAIGIKQHPTIGIKRQNNLLTRPEPTTNI